MRMKKLRRSGTDQFNHLYKRACSRCGFVWRFNAEGQTAIADRLALASGSMQFQIICSEIASESSARLDSPIP